MSEVKADPDPPSSRANDTRKFALVLLAIVLIGLGVRLTNSFVFTNYKLGGDAAYFHGQAEAIADGNGFVDPFALSERAISSQSARHPPAFTSFLAATDLLGAHGVDAQRAIATLLGCATIALVGILGRKIAGTTVGLVAAGLAAAMPALVVADAQLLSEGLYGFAIALVLLTSYRFWEQPTLRRIVALAAAVALAALTRGEALFLYVILVTPLVFLRTRSRPRPERWRTFGAAVGIAVILIGPWVAFNMVRFSHLAYSTNSGAVVMLANCDQTYDRSQSQFLGYWSASCQRTNLRGNNEAEIDASAMSKGVGYMTSHLGLFPIVAAARIGRMIDVFKPSQTVLLDAGLEGRGVWQSELTMLGFFASVAFAIPGLVILRRRLVPLLPLVSVGALALLSAVVTYGNVRFRIPLDVALIVPAAVGIVAAVRGLRATPSQGERGQ